METPYHILSRLYFKSKTHCPKGSRQGPLDLEIEEKYLEEIAAGTPDGEFRHNTALVMMLHEIPFPDRADFLRHHAERSGEPVRWLAGVAGLLGEMLGQSFLYDDSLMDGFRRIAVALVGEFQRREGATPQQRLRWKGSPESFFWVFGAMIQHGLLEAEGGNDAVAALLQRFIEVPTKGRADAEYSIGSFRQNLKPTSNLQTGGKDHEEMRDRVEEMIRKLPR